MHVEWVATLNAVDILRKAWPQVQERMNMIGRHKVTERLLGKLQNIHWTQSGNESNDEVPRVINIYTIIL